MRVSPPTTSRRGRLPRFRGRSSRLLAPCRRLTVSQRPPTARRRGKVCACRYPQTVVSLLRLITTGSLYPLLRRRRHSTSDGSQALREPGEPEHRAVPGSPEGRVRWWSRDGAGGSPLGWRPPGVSGVLRMWYPNSPPQLRPAQQQPCRHRGGQQRRRQQRAAVRVKEYGRTCGGSSGGGTS